MTVVWHNPRCSKSRATLALLEERGIAFEVREYLKAPPTTAEIEALLDALGIEPRDLVRTGEAAFREAGLGADSSAAELIAAMAAHPILIERPIVIRDGRAAIGRPPDAVLGLFGD